MRLEQERFTADLDSLRRERDRLASERRSLESKGGELSDLVRRVADAPVGEAVSLTLRQRAANHPNQAGTHLEGLLGGRTALAATVPTREGGQRLGLRPRAGGDGGAGLEQGPGDPEPDALGAAGDQRHAAGQVDRDHHGLLLVGRVRREPSNC